MTLNPSILSTALQYALTTIFALEQAIPEGGLGTMKKQIVLNGIETLVKATAIETGALAQAGSNAPTNTIINLIASAVGSFIDTTVNNLKTANAGPFSTTTAKT